MGSQQGMVIPFDGVHHVHQSSPGKGILVIGSGCILCHQLYLSGRGGNPGKKCRKMLRQSVPRKDLKPILVLLQSIFTDSRFFEIVMSQNMHYFSRNRASEGQQKRKEKNSYYCSSSASLQRPPGFRSRCRAAPGSDIRPESVR